MRIKYNYHLSIQCQNSVIVSDSKFFLCLWLPDLLCFPDASTSGDAKSRVTDSSQSPSYRIRTESEQVSLFTPEQSSLHESEGLLLPSRHLLFSNFVSCSSSPRKSLLHWWHRAMFCLALLPFPCWCFEVSPMTTDDSSQLMKGWMMSQGTLNYRVVERFFLSCTYYLSLVMLHR